MWVFSIFWLNRSKVYNRSESSVSLQISVWDPLWRRGLQPLDGCVMEVWHFLKHLKKKEILFCAEQLLLASWIRVLTKMDFVLKRPVHWVWSSIRHVDCIQRSGFLKVQCNNTEYKNKELFHGFKNYRNSTSWLVDLREVFKRIQRISQVSRLENWIYSIQEV